MSKENVKFLNLDEIAPTRTLTIRVDGVDHEMAEMTVEDFLWSQRELKNLVKAKDEEEYFDATLGMLSRQFPTISADKFRKMPIEKLKALVDFCQAAALDGADTQVEEAAAATSEGEEGNAPAER